MANWDQAPQIEGLPEVLAKLAGAGVEITARAEAALEAGAEVIASAAKANLAEHTWTGRLAESMQVRPRGPLLMVVRSATPGGSALEYGWTSKAGLQPPSGKRSRLRKWLSAQGADPSLAFVVARRIGETGYGFAPTHWLSRAGEESTPEVLGTLVEATRL